MRGMVSLSFLSGRGGCKSTASVWSVLCSVCSWCVVVWRVQLVCGCMACAVGVWWSVSACMFGVWWSVSVCVFGVWWSVSVCVFGVWWSVSVCKFGVWRSGVYVRSVEVWCVYLECGGLVCILEVWRSGVYTWCVEVWCVYLVCGGLVCILGVWWSGVYTWSVVCKMPLSEPPCMCE